MQSREIRRRNGDPSWQLDIEIPGGRRMLIIDDASNLRIVCPLISISWNFGRERDLCGVWGICEKEIFHRGEEKRKGKRKEKFWKDLEENLSSRSIRGRKRKKGDRNAFWGWKLDWREGRWPKITACTVVFSSLLRETRQAVELIGDKIEQFTCAAAKRRESVLSFDREARGIYHTYVCKYMRPIDFPCVSIIQSSVSLNNSSAF